ncbi:MAG: DUF1761 domain-containing protein [Planktotalea sp.]|uniref:DUF1761 domain-containing protein n=1 Tax=Planktotalea sp. TaxID=2029877 RepID=UPI003C72EF82
MELINVLVAAAVGFGVGAVWYGVFSKQWMAVSGVTVGADGKPANNSDPMPFIMGFLAMVLVAGMMRHVFALSDIDTLGKGLVSGFGIGLFLAAPWLMICYGFAGRPRQLLLIDGGYAAIGSAAIGLVLTAF